MPRAQCMASAMCFGRGNAKTNSSDTCVQRSWRCENNSLIEKNYRLLVPSMTRAMRQTSRTTSAAAAFWPSSPLTPPTNTTSTTNEETMMTTSKIYRQQQQHLVVSAFFRIRISFILFAYNLSNCLLYTLLLWWSVDVYQGLEVSTLCLGLESIFYPPLSIAKGAVTPWRFSQRTPSVFRFFGKRW